MQYLVIKLSHYNVTFLDLFPVAGDIADLDVSSLISSDIFDVLICGSVDDNSQYKQLLKLLKKYILKSAFLRLAGYGLTENINVDQTKISEDINTLRDLIRSKNISYHKSTDNTEFNSIISCIH